MSSLTLFNSSGSMPVLVLTAVFLFVCPLIFMGIVTMWMLLKQKISDELSTCVTKIKHEIADDLSAHGTKIANELDAKNNTTITAEIERILTDVYKKLTAEINTKISNELSTRLSEINTELNDKLTAEIKKINSRDAGYTSEAQKLFNDMATRINNIEEACRRNQPIEADQQSVSNHSEASNRSHISSSGSSSGSSS